MADNMWDTIIVGAGPAGLMAGIQAARRGQQVCILEKTDRPGKKLRITGKGRCNVTNCCTVEDFMPNVLANPRFLYSSLNAFTPYEVMGFFEELGVPLKVERGDRVFPESDNAHHIADALVCCAVESGCLIRQGEVKNLLLEEGRAAGVQLSDGSQLRSRSVILCTGGKSYPVTGSTGDGYTLARQAGHNITPLRASLIPILCAERCCRDMMGLSLRNVTLSVTQKNASGKEKLIFQELGEMLFTHFGVSGPLVLSASCHMTGKLSSYTLAIDLKPGLSEEQLDARILRDFGQFANKDFINSLGQLLPRKAIPVIAQRSGIPFDTKVNQITRPQRQALCQAIKHFTLTPTGFRPIEEAIVTAGGVDVGQLNPKTMESKLCPGLYFAGELLDVDGYTGGFNLQIAFSTGFAAGSHCGE